MFKDSCVTRLTPWSLREEATRLPTAIFPAYIGSGTSVLSIDASGLQGLNHGLQAAFMSAPLLGDMYLVKNGMTGDQLSPDNVLPLGWLDWRLRLDNSEIDMSNLAEHAALWSRNLLLDEAKVVTRMLIDQRLVLELAAWIPYGSSSPVLEITLQSQRYAGESEARLLNVEFGVGINLTTRQGAPLCHECAVDQAGLLIKMRGSELYTLNLKLASAPVTQTEFADNRYGLTWKTMIGAQAQTLTCLFGFDNEFSIDQIDERRAKHNADWHDHYRALASIAGLGLKEIFLYHNSLYLLHAGFDYSKGITIGAPFYQPWYWKASVFWDSHMVIDGLMRAGAKNEALQFLDLLNRAMKPRGKPFPWMFHYDGSSTVDDTRDFAPLVIAAHAMTAIKVYEYYRDQETLERLVFPICKRIGDYAVETLFRRDEFGWVVAVPVSNDIVEDEAVEINQTYTTVWFLSVLKKVVEYANLLGRGTELDGRYNEILAGYHLESNENEYLHARGVSAADSPGASWLPFLLYPTEGAPLLDLGLFGQTRAKYDFSQLYMEKQGSYQPWTCFLQAQSDVRAGLGEAALVDLQEGLNYVFGPGFFSEIGPQQQTGGLPPYSSAHGAYLGALFGLFVNDSIWEKRISIFAHTPASLLKEQVAISGLQCVGAIKVDAVFSDDQARVTLRGDLSGYELLLARPPGVARADLRVVINGAPATAWQIGADGAVTVRICEIAPQYEVVLR